MNSGKDTTPYHWTISHVPMWAFTGSSPNQGQRWPPSSSCTLGRWSIVSTFQPYITHVPSSCFPFNHRPYTIPLYSPWWRHPWWSNEHVEGVRRTLRHACPECSQASCKSCSCHLRDFESKSSFFYWRFSVWRTWTRTLTNRIINSKTVKANRNAVEELVKYMAQVIGVIVRHTADNRETAKKGDFEHDVLTLTQWVPSVPVWPAHKLNVRHQNAGGDPITSIKKSKIRKVFSAGADRDTICALQGQLKNAFDVFGVRFQCQLNQRE